MIKKISNKLFLHSFSSFKSIKEKGEITPDNHVLFVQNLYFQPDGSLKRFPALKKRISISNPHSIYKINPSQFLLCSMSDNKDNLYLYNYDTNSLTFITEAGTSYMRMWYVHHLDKVYISNKFWNGILSLKDLTIHTWEPTSSYLYETVKEASDYIFVDAIPMPKCENLTFYAGRIFGSIENTIYFTEPVFCNFTKPYNFIDLKAKISFLLSDSAYLYIGTDRGFYTYTFNTEGVFFMTKHSDIECLPNGAFYNNNTLVFLSNEGLMFFKEGKLSVLSYPYIDIRASGECRSGTLDNTDGFIGGENLSLSFTDSVVADVIKNNRRVT